MRVVNLLLTTALLATLGMLSSAAQAAEKGAIKLTSIAQTEVAESDTSGKKTFKRTPADKVVPGTEVIYTTTFENVSDKPVGSIVINNPIPNDSEYKSGSAYGKNCEILFSVDGGKTYGRAVELKVKGTNGKSRNALPREYTNIRWTYKGKLAAGKSGEAGFRATVK